MPITLVTSYYANQSSILTGLNQLLSQTVVNQTCQGNFECIHDYLIRINSFSSAATATQLQTNEQSRTTLGNKFIFHSYTYTCYYYFL